jgi:hypothetical protein
MRDEAIPKQEKDCRNIECATRAAAKKIRVTGFYFNMLHFDKHNILAKLQFICIFAP